MDGKGGLIDSICLATVTPKRDGLTLGPVGNIRKHRTGGEGGEDTLTAQVMNSMSGPVWEAQGYKPGNAREGHKLQPHRVLELNQMCPTSLNLLFACHLSSCSFRSPLFRLFLALIHTL